MIPVLNSRAVAALSRVLDAEPGTGFPGALCAQIGPELYFTEEGLGVSDNDRMALLLCYRCPARAQCLLFALDNPDTSHYGAWGGLRQRNLEWLKKQPVHGPDRPPEGE